MGACGSSGTGRGRERRRSSDDDDANGGGGRRRRSSSPSSSASDDDSEESLTVLEGIYDAYEFGAQLGSGKFAVVVKGRERRGGGEVAIKCIKKITVAEEGSLEFLKREIQIMKKLDHPNIVKLVAVYEEAEEFYLVMELVDGKELFDRIISRGHYTERDAAATVRQLCDALAYMHAASVAHRDLKPENILSSMVDGVERIKITDFGLAKEFAGAALETACGTEGYVAPEVITDDTYDKSADLWSLGVIIFVLLSGQQPFYAPSPPEYLEKIKHADYAFDDPLWASVSDAAKDVIRSLLVIEPASRLTAAQMLDNAWVTGELAPDTELRTQTNLKSQLTQATTKKK